MSYLLRFSDSVCIDSDQATRLLSQSRDVAVANISRMRQISVGAAKQVYEALLEHAKATLPKPGHLESKCAEALSVDVARPDPEDASTIPVSYIKHYEATETARVPKDLMQTLRVLLSRSLSHPMHQGLREEMALHILQMHDKSLNDRSAASLVVAIQQSKAFQALPYALKS